MKPIAGERVWSLEYLPSNHGGDATTLIKIDWVFIGIFMSFFVILFTFDAIVGERSAWNVKFNDV